jgi:hypothetical protein
LASSSPEQIRATFKLSQVAVARALQKRATDFLEHGFAEALRRSQENEKKRFQKDPRAPKVGSKELLHYHSNLWRPYVAPKCRPIREVLTEHNAFLTGEMHRLKLHISDSGYYIVPISNQSSGRLV